MFTNGKLIIFFIILKYTSFMRLLLAENSIYITYESYNNTSNGLHNVATQTPNATIGNDTFLYMATKIQPEYNTKTPRIENKLREHENDFHDKSTTKPYESLPQPEAVFGAKYYPYQTKQEIFRQQQIPAATQDTGLPVFPERTDAVYFIVAVIGGAKSWGRTLARTLLDMGPPFGSPMGPPLRPLYVDLPPNRRFSVKVLMSLCQQGDGIPLAGIVVIGDGQSARAVALSGNAMNVPVLWAKGGKANIYAANGETQSSLQAMLQPSAREILGAIRSLFLQAHWHSFFVLSDVEATMVLNSPEGALLRKPPLQSKILPLLAGKGDVFRQLAEISRSTRGIVLLLCNLDSARKIMTEAKRLNMVAGHFIWLWADTSSTTEFFDLHQQSSHGTKIVEYPDAVKQFSAQDFDEEHQSLPKYVEDLVESKMVDEDLNAEQRNKIVIKTSDKDKSRGELELHSPQQQQQILYPTNTRQSNGAGRYIFGLNHNGGDSFETKTNKEKRNSKGFLKGLILHSEIQGYSGKFIGANYDTKQKRLGLDYEEFEQVDSDYVDSSMDVANNSSYSWLPVLNESERTENRNVKLKRTSQYYEQNSTNSHVLFHHFKDFPVGLLALRPIKMPIDRSFIRSTLRLFASTWAKVDQEMTQSENFRPMSRSQNPYEFDKAKYFHDRDLRRRNLFIYHKRRRRQILHSNKTVNRNFSIPVNVRTSSSNISNKNVRFNTRRNTNYSVDNSSYNQNLSGLPNLSIESNNSLRRSILYDRNNSMRYDTWWSVVKDSTVRIKHSQPSSGLNSNGGDRYRKSVSYYRGGCFGSASRQDIKRAETFAGVLREATALALAGQKILDGSFEKSLITSFELLNLVPDDNGGKSKVLVEAAFDRRRGPRKPLRQLTKWRKVGLISGTKVQLDTIVWPGGDIIVSGMSARARPVFRVVTALAPPFVMEAEQDEDERCLRGLPCHRLSPNSVHNLTLMFNAIETRDRVKENTQKIGDWVREDDVGNYDHTLYQTKCCYGLSMDLLDNIATELGFEFHLYLVQDELFGSKFHTTYSTKSETHDDLAFTRRRQSHRREKLQKHYTEEPVLSKHHHSRQTPSFERETTFRGNEDEDSKRNTDEDEEVTVEEWNAENYKPSAKENNKIGDNNEKHFSRRFFGKVQWNGIIGDLISGSADMSFAPLSVSRARAEVIDFSAPYFYSGVSWLAAPQSKSEIPLLAFLLPFSPELWIAIFTSLNVTAIAVAIYEWLSPFGLNPWGRQRSKNFSMSSALWVMWGLLCGHLVAFKAPKSWPNKFLINVWGGFSVIFIASYTANIAALIAGLFFHNASNRPDVALLAQRVGAPAASAAESYIKEDQHLWEHMKKFKLKNIDDGIRGLKNGTLDLLLGDTPILDYYRATDPGCTLQRIGDSFVEDTYAVGMSKGFPLKDSISAIIAKYSSNGYLDILTEKWYGELPCFKLHNDIVQPRPLGVEAVAGVFLLLGLGVILGVLILIFEHLFYKYTLPILRHKPKGTIWKSRNIMFFSQKLYRFINCVELVSPHHAARELVHTLRQGQIASLFQKSIKRKEDEQRRRRKSKAQFFEMIQEIRRVQQQERANPKLEVVTELEPSTGENAEPAQKPRVSPKTRLFANRKESRSRSNSSTLNVRRFSTDSILSERLDSIGRRLSRDLTNSPPDFAKRFEAFGKNNTKKYDTFSGGRNLSKEKIEETKFDTFSGKDFKRLSFPVKKYISKRVSLNSDRFASQENIEIDNDTKLNSQTIPNEVIVDLIYQEDESTAILGNQLNHELPSKYRNESSTKGSSNLYAEVQKRPRDRSSQQHHRQRSLDGLDARPPMPVPTSRNSQNDLQSMDSQTQSLPPKNQSRSNLKQISLDRLSREDLLKLSESSQTEIHEYLSKTSRESQGEPP